MGQLYIVRTIFNNLLECSDNSSNMHSFEVKLPWLQFLPHLDPFDHVFIKHKKGVVDKSGFLILEPHYLVAVTRTIDALSCPRKIYIKTMGAEEIHDKFQFKRMTQGNLLHNVFSQRVATGASVEESIKTVLSQSQLELLASNMSQDEALTYLNNDAGVLRNLTLRGQTEIDCQNWKLGLHGKFDSINNNQIIELKSSKIPDVQPWPNHNLQMTAYIKMMEDRGEHKGTVLYVRDGQMSMKYPTKWDHKKTMIARNYAYLVLSGKLIPPVLRGERSFTCRRCFVKEGCYNLCSGLETQRDCQDCYLEQFCNQQSWNKTSQDYYLRLTTALTEEETEESREQYLFSRAGISDKRELDNLLNRGFACITQEKIFQTIERGVFITKFRQNSKMSRFRRGDMARAYNLQTTHEHVTLFHSIIITSITRETITLESTNELPVELCIVPSSSSSNPRTGRRALYRTTKSSSHLLAIIRGTLLGVLDLPEIEEKPIKLQSPLQEYNHMQLESMSKALTTPDLLLIQGPAGTGKTSIIVELINELYLQGKSLLCSAFTNMAIDNVGLKLKEAGIPFIRLGNLHVMNRALQDQSAIAQPDLFKQAVEKKIATVVLSTTSTIARRQYEELWFDYVLLDEAAQMTEPDALKALLQGEKAIIVGDHAQLQPIVISNNAHRMNLHISLFERLVKALPERFIQLVDQYRMNDEILKFPNELFYQGTLRSANVEIGSQTLKPFTGKLISHIPYEILAIDDPAHNPSQQVNHSEGVLIVAVLDELFRMNSDLQVEDIGIITPFRAQVAHLRALLPSFHIDTVDRYQGSEREIIIYSTITMQDIPILTDPRRLNVALTRAKKKLLVLLSNPSETRKISHLDILYQDGIKREIVRHIGADTLSRLKEFRILEQNRDSVLQQIKIEYSAIDSQVYSNYIDKFDKSIGDHVNIFFKANQLTVRKIEDYASCPICIQRVNLGIQCLGCAYWFHEDHLRMWLEKNNCCPVCKNTLQTIRQN